MLDEVRRVGARLSGGRTGEDDEPWYAHPPYLRAATAQLFLATGAGATLEHLTGRRNDGRVVRTSIPVSLAWAPALLAPLAAAAHLLHSQRPDEGTRQAVRFLDAAVIALGGALFAFDLMSGEQPQPRFAPLAFVSVGLLGIAVDRQETETERTEADLRRRARVVERLVPKRKPKLDRVVLHL